MWTWDWVNYTSGCEQQSPIQGSSCTFHTENYLSWSQNAALEQPELAQELLDVNVQCHVYIGPCVCTHIRGTGLPTPRSLSIPVRHISIQSLEFHVMQPALSCSPNVRHRFYPIYPNHLLAGLVWLYGSKSSSLRSAPSNSLPRCVFSMPWPDPRTLVIRAFRNLSGLSLSIVAASRPGG